MRFNSRTYMLADGVAAEACDGIDFGDDDYSCVDYARGAYHLAGKELSFAVELDYADCGCNAAVYLVAMAQNPDPTICKDYYCDANSVCGVPCIEIDLMEANRNAFIVTVHVGDDPNGEGFGIGHYVSQQKRFVSTASACAYGPRDTCTINTHHRFTARYRFSAEGEPFSFTVVLEQEGRSVSLGEPVRYLSKPNKGAIGSAEEANDILRAQLDAGLNLVISYWAGPKRSDMAWLDEPCTSQERDEGWCSDVWSEQKPMWPFVCNTRGGDPPECLGYWTLAELRHGTPTIFTWPVIGLGLLVTAVAAAAALRQAGALGLASRRAVRGAELELGPTDFDEEELRSPETTTSRYAAHARSHVPSSALCTQSALCSCIARVRLASAPSLSSLTSVGVRRAVSAALCVCVLLCLSSQAAQARIIGYAGICRDSADGLGRRELVGEGRKSSCRGEDARQEACQEGGGVCEGRF